MLSSTNPARLQSRWAGQHQPVSDCALDQPLKNKSRILLPNAALHTPVFFIISLASCSFTVWKASSQISQASTNPTHPLLSQALD